MITLSKSIHDHHRLLLEHEHKRFQEEICQAAREEFPPGTRVSWRMHGHKESTEGEVTGHMQGETGMVTVRSDGGTGYTLRAWELVKLEAAP